MKKYIKYSLFIIICFLVMSCGNTNEVIDETTEEVDRVELDQALVSSERLFCFTEEELAIYIPLFENKFLYESIEPGSGFCVYKIIYETQKVSVLEGTVEDIQASGIVTVPNIPKETDPIMMYTHGDYASTSEGANVSNWTKALFEQLSVEDQESIIDVIASTSLSGEYELFMAVQQQTSIPILTLLNLADSLSELNLFLPLMNRGVFIAPDLLYLGADFFDEEAMSTHTCYDETRFPEYSNEVNNYDCSVVINDMLIAAQNLLEELAVSVSNEVYITGFSAGAYPTAELHAILEEDDYFRLNYSQPSNGLYPSQGWALSVPMAIHHNQSDQTVSVELAEVYYDAMMGVDGNESLISLVDSHESSDHLDGLFWAMSYFYMAMFNQE